MLAFARSRVPLVSWTSLVPTMTRARLSSSEKRQKLVVYVNGERISVDPRDIEPQDLRVYVI
eukprot:1354964-Amorphochlora_amoeboformis.AAC.1